MRKTKIILSVVTLLLIVLFSLAVLFKVPYYRVLFEVTGIKIRSMYITIAFFSIVVIVQIIIFSLNKGKKIVQYTLIIFCFVYCTLMQSFVDYKSVPEIEEQVEKQVANFYNCEDIQNYNDIYYCYFGKTIGKLNIYYNNAVKSDAKDNIKRIKMVVVGDDDFRTREEYNISQNKRVWIKNDVCQIDIKESMCDSYDISHIEHLDYYVIINETKVYDMGTVYENNYLTRLFARGDMTEFFDWITMQKLYVQTVVVLIFLLMLNLFDKTIENKLLERKKERIIDDLIEFYLTLRDVYKITKFNLKEIKLETVRINNTIEVNVYRNRSCYDKKEKIVILRIREEEVNIIGLKILAWTLKDILVDLTGSDYEQEGKEVGYIVSNLLEPLRQEGIKL